MVTRTRFVDGSGKGLTLKETLWPHFMKLLLRLLKKHIRAFKKKKYDRSPNFIGCSSS
jgi:hypothetical protein